MMILQPTNSIQTYAREMCNVKREMVNCGLWVVSWVL